MTDEMHLRDEQLYIVSCRLAKLRVVANILRDAHVTSASERDKAAINTAYTKVQGVILRSERELEQLISK